MGVASRGGEPLPAIEAEELGKSFGDVRAVDGLSFTVRTGELFGFLGPNGAGKTTTINMLTGLARPDSGKIRIAGVDCARNPKDAQRLMGIVADESNLYPELTGFGNLCFCASLYGMKRRARENAAREWLEKFGLEEASGKRFAQYSRGMKRKLAIAAGIIHGPKILFLDEPTTGIDVAAARQIRRLIGDLRQGGMTIFLTTHYIEEAERLCDRVAFIVRGRIVLSAPTGELLDRAGSRHVVELTALPQTQALWKSVQEAFPALECRMMAGGALRVTSTEPVHIGAIVRLIEEMGSEVLEARRITPSLEEVFVEVTGIETDAMKREKGGGGA